MACTGLAAIGGVILLTSTSLASTLRCGWIHNPTPGNWWLTDRAGDWTIATQGIDAADILAPVPDLTGRDWVVTNGASYGYGCACLHVVADRESKRILRISSFRQVVIAACRRDRRLPKP